MPLRARETATAGAIRRIFDYATARGLAPAELTRATGIEGGGLRDPASRVGMGPVYALWTHLRGRLSDDALPIRVAESACLEDLHLLGFAVLTARSARDALALLGRHGSQVTDSGTWRVGESGRELSIQWVRPADSVGVRLSNETAIAQLVGCLRQIMGDDLEPLQVSFRHPAPRRALAHRDFFRCDVMFGAPFDGVRLSRDRLDAAPPCNNAALHAHIWGVLEAARPAEGGSTVGAVRAIVARRLTEGFIPSLPTAAQALGTTERTLRRLLRAEGVSFRILLDEVRAERAKELLSREDRSITQVAFELGFSDSSAFTHACQRWLGRSPSDLRRHIRLPQR